MANRNLGRQFQGMHVWHIPTDQFVRDAHPGEPVDAGKDWAEVRARGGYDDLRDSIAKHGLEKPVLLDMQDGAVKDGHHRAAALMDLGASHIPVIDYNQHGWPQGYS